MPFPTTLRRLRIVALVLLVPVVSAAQDDAGAEWPKEIERPNATITVYQPQVERFEDTELSARAAVSVERDGGPPEFGAIWIDARVDSDRGARVATLREVTVPRARFADASEVEQQQLATIVEESVPDSGLEISLDLLIADLDPAGRSAAEDQLRHEPPRMLYRQEPTILISVDGDPIYQEVPESGGVERVVNTPFTLVRFRKALYLGGGGGLWYRALALEGPWQVVLKPPAEVAAFEPEQDAVERSEGEPPPAVLVATEPTEIVVSDGKPTWTPVAGGDLLYLDNSDSDVFLEVSTQMYYVALSGRWYRGHAVADHWEWEHVANDALPRAFAEIPEESPNGHVLPLVGGTDQARDAVLDNTIPQTAAVKREGGAPLEIQYDGKPKFERIEGIPASYAVNTPSAVFDVGRHYWACEQGIWYDASSATGPWKVATEVPEVLYRIPASNPHYNVTYVKVYQTTPEVVYVGYTPAYLGSYVYAGSVVYGTGWIYRPWWGHVYYPRYPTWGFNVSYSPWTGWGFGVSWHAGPFSFSFGTGGGWFGPVGYRPWRRPYVGGGFRKTDIDIDRSINVGDISIDRSRRTELRQNVNNVYARGNNRDRVVANSDRRPGTGQRPGIDRPGAARPGTRPGTRPATQPGLTRPSNRPNDVLTDRSGNVYRRAQNGSWQQRQDRSWKPAQNLDRPATRDVQRPATDSIQRPSAGSVQRRDVQAARRPQIERSHQARTHGAQRNASFQNARRAGGGGGLRRR